VAAHAATQDLPLFRNSMSARARCNLFRARHSMGGVVRWILVLSSGGFQWNPIAAFFLLVGCRLAGGSLLLWTSGANCRSSRARSAESNSAR